MKSIFKIVFLVVFACFVISCNEKEEKTDNVVLEEHVPCSDQQVEEVAENTEGIEDRELSEYEKSLLPEAEDIRFISQPEGSSYNTHVSGDFFADGFTYDLIVIDYTDKFERSLILQKNIDENNAEVIFINNKAMLQANDGGVMSDPFESLTFKDGEIVFSYYGGSRYRWIEKYYFKPENSKFVLTKYYSRFFDAFDEEDVEISEKEFEADEHKMSEFDVSKIR